ncbi:phenoloxidase-activating factor 2-like [Drosophila teissieri]|uniref:phenoloxidase-activating factor 2-like n=1 Tax=Drosophila teissieri TaxID=7243 RepID=UPI001CB9D9B2|nr:phenoloxidase-activating factor 2-like [Drosophila teissieri]
MTGFLRLLALLCAVSKLSAQIFYTPKELQNVKRNTFLIFGANQPRPTIRSYPELITPLPPKGEILQGGVDAPNCECVPYHKCDPASDRVTEDGSFDKFGSQNVRQTRCADILALCCPHHRLRTKTLNPRPKPNRGCGIRNVGGLDFDIKGATQYESDIGEFPWTVAILHSGNYSFAGTLIHPRVVLTAAHRVQQWQTYTVRAGEWDFKSTNERLPSQEIEVERVIKHPTYSEINLQNNMALLILKQSFSLDDHINVICLPDHGAAPPPTSVCYANGWGKDGFGDLGHIAIMKRLPLHIVEHTECQDRFRKSLLGPAFSLSTSLLCAGGQSATDMCQGDGGGPLACPLGDPRENRYQLSGIVSFGIRCNTDWPAAYSNVALMRNWIDQEMTANGFDKSYYTA